MPRALGSTKSTSDRVPEGEGISVLEKTPQQENTSSCQEDRAEVPGFFWIFEDQRFVLCTNISTGGGQRCSLIFPFLLPQAESKGSSSDLVSPSSSSIEPKLSKSKKKKMAREASRRQPFNGDISEWLPPPPMTNSDPVKNSKKKAKKKSKKTKKTSKSETSSSEGVRGSSISACANSDLANKGPYMDYELPEITEEESDVERISVSRVTQPETPSTVASHSDRLVASSSPVPSEEFHSAKSEISGTNEMENKYFPLSNFNEETAYTHQSTDFSSEAFSDAHSAPFTDSVSDGWNSYESTNADDVEDQSFVREYRVINPSEASAFSKSGYLLDLPGSGDLSTGTSSHEGLDKKDEHLSDHFIENHSAGGKSSDGPIGNKNHLVWQKVEKDNVGVGISDLGASSLLPLDEYPLVEESRNRVPKRSRLPLVLPVKRKQKGKKLSENSASGRRLSVGGDVSGGPIGKENHLAWQKIQKDDAGEGVSDSSASLLPLDEYPLVKQEFSCGSIVGSSDTTLARPRTTNMLYREALQLKGQANQKNQRPTNLKMRHKEARTLPKQAQHPKQAHWQARLSSKSGEASMVRVNVSEPVSNPEICRNASKTQGSVLTAATNPVDVNTSKPITNEENVKDKTKMLQDVKIAAHPIECKASEPVTKLEICKDERSELGVCATVCAVGVCDISKPVLNADNSKGESKVLQDLIKTSSHPIDLKASKPVANLEVCNDERSELGVCAIVTPLGGCDACEQFTESEISENVRNVLQNVCNTVSDANGKTLSSSTPEMEDQNCSLLGLSERCTSIPVTDTAGIIQQIEDSWVECGNQGHISGSISKKRLPVLRQDVSGETGKRTDEYSLGSVDKSVSEDLGPRKHTGKKLNPDAQIFVPVYGIKVGHVGFVPDLKIETEIEEAVRDTYKMEMSSAGVHLAEFETFIHSASPVIGESQECLSCSSDHFIGTSLVPNVYLAQLWEWYEGHSSFGLEVKTEDYLTSEYSAYYTPYLSAIQLFQNSRRTSDCSRLVTSSGLLPQPREHDFTVNSLGMTSIEPELLFEYYELEQPFHRRPLFDKIKELVRGGGVQNCRTYGDPKNLEFSNLQNLHPSSWYCIAWYPVYRIPRGKLKGAFLTYHSLGHFVKDTPSDGRGGSTTNIVVPVVGLQSYKAQEESWFKLRPALMTQTPNHAEILKERLRSLEKTACVMSRAVVNQGEQKSANKHQDFEFFASRGGLS